MGRSSELEKIRNILQSSQLQMSDFFGIERGHYSMIELGHRSSSEINPELRKLASIITTNLPSVKIPVDITEADRKKMQNRHMLLNSRLILAKIKYDEAKKKLEKLSVALQIFQDVNPDTINDKRARQGVVLWKNYQIFTKQTALHRYRDIVMLELEAKVKTLEIEIELISQFLAKGNS